MEEKRRSPLGICLQILGIVMMLAAFAVALMIVVPKVLGYQEYTVITGSMEPEMPVGSLVLVKSAEPGTLKKGDVISYERERDRSVITHRVVENSSETKTITTKGDANDEVDMEPVGYEQVLGKVEKTIPVVGKITVMLSTLAGRIGLVMILIAGYLLSLAGSNMTRR